MTAAALLFDLDGTIANSAPGIRASLRHAFAANGLAPLDPATEFSLIGPPFRESLPHLIDPDAVSGVIASYREHYGAGAMFETTVFPGVRELLEQAAATGVRLAVATSKTERFAEPIVEHLGLRGLFAAVVGDTKDGTRNTKALVVAEALRQLGQPDPGDVLMVGDRRHDVEGARANGIGCVAVTWRYARPGELEAAQPIAICATAAELADALGVDVRAATR